MLLLPDPCLSHEIWFVSACSPIADLQCCMGPVPVSLTFMLFPMQHVGKDQKGEKIKPFT